jgi:subtilisin family serine protease
MNKYKFSIFILSGITIVMLLGSAPAQASSQPPSAPGPLAALDSKKIDPKLIKELDAKGQADFFIWLVAKADLSPAYKLTSKEEKGRYVFETLKATAEHTQQDLIIWLKGQGVDYQSFYIANKILVRSGDRTLLDQVAARSDVARLTLNARFQAIEPIVNPSSNQHITALEPNISFINADDVWALGITGQGSVVAGNDTGLDATHPAIARHYRGCLNPPACTLWDHNYNWWDATGRYPTNPWDNNAHGTHTTGTMVGDDGGANQIGVAPGAQTIHCKNMDADGNGVVEWFEVCFEWDLAPWDLNGQNPDPTKAPDAINNSWGFTGGEDAFRDEVAALQAAGILVEVSAGNEGPGCSTLRSPGDYAEVLTTGSTNHAFAYPGLLTGFSSRGPSLRDAGYFPDILAPGENIRSSVPGGGYEGGWSGTSMSGPHVTGLVALLWSANPLLRGQVEITNDIIKHTAVPLTGQTGSECRGNYVSGPNNDWGYGTIDALAAVQFALAYDGSGTLTGVVTDPTDNPIESAMVWAAYSPTITFQTTTDGAGLYDQLVYSGTYEVSAMAYGYGMETYSDISVISGTTTVQDFTLTLAGTHIISGTVRDALTDWPLYAHITVKGDPFDPPAPLNETWSDPQTGFYSLVLAEDITYTIQMEAFTQGYLPGEANIPPLSGDMTLNLALEPDPNVCPANGYEFSIEGLAEPFESQQTPPGWEVIDNAGTGAVWTFDDPSGRGNLTGGGGFFAIADSARAGMVDMDTELRSPVLDFSSSSTVNLAFNYDFYAATDEIAEVDVSQNGNSGPWINVWRRSGTSDRGPAQAWLDISKYVAGQSQVMIRFHYYNAYYEWWWEVDHFLVGVWSCTPQPGGLVVGNVTDANIGLGLNEALVAGDNGQEIQTVPTPLDPQVADGFYTLFSPAATHTFTSTLGGYGQVASEVNVVPSDTVRLDFDLPAGWVQASPETLAITLEQGQTGTLPLTLTNLGGFGATFNLLEIDRGPAQGRDAFADAPQSPGWFTSLPIPEPLSAIAGVQCADTLDSFYLAGGQVDILVPTNHMWRFDANVPQWVSLAPLPQPVELASATCYEGKIYVAGGSNGVIDLNTLYIYDIATDSWKQGANLPRASWGTALGAWTGHLYLAGGTGVNNDNVDIYDILSDSWAPGSGTPIPQITFLSGWAQLDSYLYLVGGYEIWAGSEVNLTQRYDMAADAWEQGPTFSSRRSAFALGVTEKYLYAIGGDLPGGSFFEQTPQVEILDHTAWPFGAWHDLGDPTPQEIGFQSSFCTPALEGGNIWSIGGSYDSVYANDFNWYHPAELCYQPPSDVNWLSEDPVSGSLEAGQASPVQINFDARMPEMMPGEYRARLRVDTDTPYGANFIPVLLTVKQPDYALKLEPTTLELSGLPGDTVMYTLHLTNTGTLTDTYDLTAVGNEWEVILPVTQTTLAPGEETDLLVNVLIPAGAAYNEMDNVVITATSQGDPGQSDSSTLTTTAMEVHGVELTADPLALSDFPGQVVTYTLHITNTGNNTDTILITYAGNLWEVTIPITNVALAAGESKDVIVYATVEEYGLSGDQDRVIFTVTSQGDSDASKQVTLTTTALGEVYLPVIRK